MLFLLLWLLWPILVFAYYKKINTLKTVICMIHIITVILGLLASGAALYLVMFSQVITVPIYWLSAWGLARIIQRIRSKRYLDKGENISKLEAETKANVEDEIERYKRQRRG